MSLQAAIDGRVPTEGTASPATQSPAQSTAQPPASAAPWPSPRRAWYAVFVFALALLVNFLDRGILTLLVEPIKRDLQLSDTHMSLLMGFAFVCFYVVAGLPIARLVDSMSRRNILAAGITLWSAATGLCGLAQNFAQLFLCRIGVGVGEACSGPATFSMLADLFPKHKLPRAIAVLNFGFMAGNAGALIIGGAIVGLLSALPPIELAGIGALRGWQLAFLISGVPGLLVAALMLTVREPLRRGQSTVPGAVPDKAPPLREVLGFMKANATTFAPMFIGLALLTVLHLGGAMWLPSFFIRTYGWTPAQIGLAQGLIWLLVWPLGAVFGSWLAERFTAQGRLDANMRVVVLANLVSLPTSIAFPLMATPEAAVALSAFNGFCGAWVLGPQNAALQIITPNRMRGQMTALFLFVFNVIGFGAGPTVIALFSDLLYGGHKLQLAYALSTAAALMVPLAVWIVWLGLKPYARSVARAADWH